MRATRASRLLRSIVALLPAVVDFRLSSGFQRDDHLPVAFRVANVLDDHP